ncbi:MAG: hypothetical protein KAH44_04330, partial [Oricola sp.]|nr:hypothetical protein [Oricola sp.]
QNALPGGWRQVDGALLHGPSGMRCPVVINMGLTRPDGSVEDVRTALMNIRLYDQAGMDTSCDYVDANTDVHVSLYASHWPDLPVEDHFAAALKLIVDRFPVKEEAPLLVATPAMEGKGYALSTEPGETLAAGFITEPIDGATYKTALWLDETGGWHVKARATFPVVVKDGEAELSVVEMVTATMHAATMRDVEAQAGAAQTVSFGKR